MSCFEKFEACSQSIWDGCITLEVSVAESDLTSNEIPDNVFLLVNRFSFLPVALFDALEHFRQYTVEFSSDSWFECGGNPLPCLKQALYVLHGKTKPFNDLSIDQQRALWQAICVGDRVGFERVASGFRPSIPVSSPQSLQALRSLPIRIIRRDKPTLQRPVGLWKAATTALDMISPRMENLSMDSKVGAGHETEDGEGEGGGERTVSKASAGSGASTDESLVMKTIEDVIRQDFGTALGVVEDCHSLQILIQGIEVPWEAPIYELWRLMAHCDLFLYIVVL